MRFLNPLVALAKGPFCAPASGKAVLLGAVAACVIGFAGGAALADKISNPTAVFNGLDKITGRIITFDVGLNETVQFGTLQITPARLLLAGR